MIRKIVIIAPFWGQQGHVGVYRIDRFVRWLFDAGIQIVLVKAGSIDIARKTTWGREIMIKDPLGLYRSPSLDNKSAISPRKPNKLRRMLACSLFNPDPSVVWARRAAKHSLVLKYARGASWVLSSSPPESSHVATSLLAKRIQAKLIIDMRDGWLDEPLQPLLQSSKIQRWREGRLEKAILKQADHIFVTSSVWRSLLEERLSFTNDKITVLTNGYPPEGVFNLTQTQKRSANESLRLVHAGRFTGSSLSRRVSYLLEPLLLGLEVNELHGKILLLGALETSDLEEITQWKPQFKSKGWTIEVRDAVPRDEMMGILVQADGLLLLSASHAAIPSKLFEYLTIGKPIFTATPQSSAVWQLGNSLEQLFLTDYRQPDGGVASSFISACKKSEDDYIIPEQFSEEALSKIFITEVL